MTATIIVIFAIAAIAALIEITSRRSVEETAAAGDVPYAERLAPYFERPETAPAGCRPAPLGEEHLPPEEHLPVSIVEPHPDEIIAREAAEVFVHWDRERDSIERAHHEEIRSMLERLDKARQLVEETGLRTAVCDMLRIMWSWPAWLAHNDWRPPMLIDQLTCGAAEETEAEHEVRWFRWRLHEERYRLSLELRPGRAADGGKRGDLRLWVGNTLVLHLDVTRGEADPSDTWSVTDVSALDPGYWMVSINEFAGRLLIANQRMLQDYEFSYFDEKARKIAIG